MKRAITLLTEAAVYGYIATALALTALEGFY
ncbi:hypothetical protein NNJEOMEG_03981 [Fundidesulfovibrio magnetotacticus]|uniref:Uncharacterized protein n=1 Tax=Fundidesulfovibrio magnetotacticus TaxID=2730080 RepID=A0A6V8M2R4_9BACT|nr:hypothetical protein NNJEOMEG_03981 [Fundidesulfovibrio magnetotacticus]